MGAILLAIRQKTDSAGSPKILLPWSWNWVGQHEGPEAGALNFPIQF